MNFDDLRYPREQFRDKKAAGELPFGQVPMLEAASGKFVPQTNAMLRCVARLAKSPGESLQGAKLSDELRMHA